MAAAAVQTNQKEPDPSRTWLGQRSKPTQAIPKHSLLGASLEIFKKDERDEVSQIDVKKYQEEINKERRAKQERYKKTLPEYLKQHGGPMSKYKLSLLSYKFIIEPICEMINILSWFIIFERLIFTVLSVKPLL